METLSLDGKRLETLEWIDATQEVPDDDRLVLINRPASDYAVWPGYYNHNEQWISADGDEIPDSDVPFWAEMPDGPKVEEEADDDE